MLTLLKASTVAAGAAGPGRKPSRNAPWAITFTAGITAAAWAALVPAYSGDYVCVTPQQRSQAAADNAAAQGRIQAGGGAYGAYTCQQGFMWRQVVPDDYVCVTPGERAQAAADNAQTSIGDCSQVRGSIASDYAIAFDTVSGRWSNQVPVDSGCASL